MLLLQSNPSCKNPLINDPVMNARQEKHYLEIKKTIELKGGTLLSDRYETATSQVKLRCSNNHEWWTTPTGIKKGHFCRLCWGKHRTELEFCEIVKSKGGSVIGKYVNTTTHIEIQCERMHIWSTTPAVVKSGHWCSVCHSENRATVITKDVILEYVQGKNGVLLSEYTTPKGRIKIRCSANHEWSPVVYDLMTGKWCRKCSGLDSKEAEKKFHNLVEKEGGKVIGEYKNAATYIELECKKGHRVFNTLNNLRENRSLCGICTGYHPDVYRKRLFDAIEIKGGELIGEYIDGQKFVTVKCKKQHIWKTRASTIRQGVWCPRCNESKGEAEVCRVLQSLGIDYKREVRLPCLPSKEYDFLFSPDEHHYYFLEYDGIQHFTNKGFYGRTDEQFNYARDMDRLKTYVSINCAFAIIRISYMEFYEIEEHILKAMGLKQDIYVSNEDAYNWLVESEIPLSLVEKFCLLDMMWPLEDNVIKITA